MRCVMYQGHGEKCTLLKRAILSSRRPYDGTTHNYNIYKMIAKEESIAEHPIPSYPSIHPSSVPRNQKGSGANDRHLLSVKMALGCSLKRAQDRSFRFPAAHLFSATPVRLTADTTALITNDDAGRTWGRLRASSYSPLMGPHPHLGLVGHHHNPSIRMIHLRLFSLMARKKKRSRQGKQGR